MIYLIEPYNAYSPKGKKKHWSEILEEERIFHEMMLAEANKNQNPTMPPNTPSTVLSTPGNAAGAGGKPVLGYFQRNGALSASFTVASSSGASPSTASITNTTVYTGIGALSYNWIYGTGSITSNSSTPPAQGYTAPGTYTITLQVTESQFQITKSATGAFTIT